MRNLPPLTPLKAFVALGRLGSYRRAADELGVDHTVVSRHVRTLEEWIGVKLVHRSNNKTILTIEGARYFDKASLGFNILSAATQEMRTPSQSGELRLWCSSGLAAQWLPSRIAALQKLLPQVEIVIRPTRSTPDLTRRDADCEIRYGVRDEKGVQSEELVTPRMFPVANRAYLDRIGQPTCFGDLLKHTLFHENSRDQWRVWLEYAGVDLSETSLTGPRLWYSNIALEAASLGQGIALTNAMIAERALEETSVSEVLSSNIHLEPYVFHASETRWNDPVIIKVRRWFREQMKPFDFQADPDPVPVRSRPMLSAG